MYFSGKIEFGVINQSVSAFNHILGDFSLIVYQFQALSAFSAVIDRLGMLFLDGAFFSKYIEKVTEYTDIKCNPLEEHLPIHFVGGREYTWISGNVKDLDFFLADMTWIFLITLCLHSS